MWLVSPRGLFVLALLVRIAIYVARGPGDPTVQPEVETTRAAACLATHGYLGDVYPGVPGPTAHVAPIYPTLLAGLDLLLGVGTRPMLIAQALLSSVCAAAALASLPRLAQQAGLARASGELAAFAVALLPLFTYPEDVSGCWEQPLAAWTLFVILGGLLLDDARGPSRLTRWAGLGVLVGVLGLTSPALLPAAALPTLVVLGRRARGDRWRQAAALGVALGLSLAPWALRNQVRLGSPVLLRSNLGLELAIGNNDEATGRTYFTDWSDPDSPFHRRHPFEAPAEQARLRDLGEVLYMRAKASEARAWIVANPRRFLTLTAARVRAFWFPSPELWGGSKLGQARSVVATGLGLLAWSRLVLLLVRRRPGAMVLLTALVGCGLIYAVTHVEARYAYPTHPLVAMLAVDAVIAGVGWAKRRRGDVRERPRDGE